MSTDDDRYEDMERAEMQADAIDDLREEIARLTAALAESERHVVGNASALDRMVKRAVAAEAALAEQTARADAAERALEERTRERDDAQFNFRAFLDASQDARAVLGFVKGESVSDASRRVVRERDEARRLVEAVGKVSPLLAVDEDGDKWACGLCGETGEGEEDGDEPVDFDHAADCPWIACVAAARVHR